MKCKRYARRTYYVWRSYLETPKGIRFDIGRTRVTINNLLRNLLTQYRLIFFFDVSNCLIFLRVKIFPSYKRLHKRQSTRSGLTKEKLSKLCKQIEHLEKVHAHSHTHTTPTINNLIIQITTARMCHDEYQHSIISPSHHWHEVYPEQCAWKENRVSQ